MESRIQEAVAPKPEDFPKLVASSSSSIVTPQDWPADAIKAIKAPTLVISATPTYPSRAFAGDLSAARRRPFARLHERARRAAGDPARHHASRRDDGAGRPRRDLRDDSSTRRRNSRRPCRHKIDGARRSRCGRALFRSGIGRFRQLPIARRWRKKGGSSVAARRKDTLLRIHQIAIDAIYVPTARRKTLHPERCGCWPRTFWRTG